MPDFRIPPEGIEIDGLSWPGGKEITVTDAYWAKRLTEAGAEVTHDGGVSLATPPAADEGEDWFKALPPETTDWDKKPDETGDGEADGEDAGDGEADDDAEADGAGEPATKTDGAGDEPPADTGNRRRPRR